MYLYIQILYSESNDLHEDTCADREVTKTFNPEAQCFRPIDAVSNNLSQLCLSPKTSPQASPSTAATNSPPTATAPTNVPPPIGSNLTINNKQQLLAAISPAAPAATNAFLPRSQAPLTFTTATFAQTKFGSTKLKTSSKRSNRYFPHAPLRLSGIELSFSPSHFSRMSPTEFSNYIKQRAMQQQLHHSHGHSNNAISSHLGPIGTASPSRSISPNPLTTIHQQQPSDSYYFPNNSGAGSANAVMSHYTPFNSGRNASTFDSPNFAVPSLHNNNNNDSHFGHSAGNIGSGKFGGAANFLDPHNFYGLGGMVAGGATNVGGNGSSAATATSPINATPGATVTGGGINGGSQSAGGSSPSSGGSSENSKLLDGLSSFYANAGPYQHMLVAN